MKMRKTQSANVFKDCVLHFKSRGLNCVSIGKPIPLAEEQKFM